MQILWHSQIALTMEIYSEVPTARTRSALEQLSRQLDGQPTLLYEDLNGPIPYSESALDVELRGFEPLTLSMRTRCATGLRYSPWTGSQRSKLCDLLARRAARRPLVQSPTARSAASVYWS